MAAISLNKFIYYSISETRPVHRGKVICIGTGKATGGDLGWGHKLPNSYQCGSLPAESPKVQERLKLTPN